MKQTLPLSRFSERVKKQPNKQYLHQPINRKMTIFTWQDVDNQAKKIANSLILLGLKQGDKVALLSKNCAEWFIADLAIMMAGMISVPIYYTANSKTIQYILDESECQLIFIGKLDDVTEAEKAVSSSLAKIIFPYPIFDSLHSNKTEACSNNSSPAHSLLQNNHLWNDLLKGEMIEQNYQANFNDTMTITYTSGSTGNPKGVVLSYGNFACAAQDAICATQMFASDHVMSYLPLAHITERALIEVTSFYAGCSVFFVESLDTFIDDVKTAQPNVFISVPRLWNKFKSNILNKMPDKKLQRLLKIPFIGKIVANKIRRALGLNNTRAFGSGTAPISPAILAWYEKIGMPISEGWGMTETTGLACSNLPYGQNSIGTIGKPLNKIEMKINENQEILIKGDSVFKQYYKNPQATQKSFTNGWFHTGDMGAVTASGDFEIIGRIKEQFKTAKGKYVAPSPIENYLTHNLDIEQSCVIGQGRKQPIALVVMNEQNKIKNDINHKALLETLQKTNLKLESHQRLDHIVVLKQDWTTYDFLTPTLKIKRQEIEAAFNHYLTAEIEGVVYWE